VNIKVDVLNLFGWDLSAHELAWCRLIVDLPLHLGNLGITPLPASGMAPPRPSDLDQKNPLYAAYRTRQIERGREIARKRLLRAQLHPKEVDPTERQKKIERGRAILQRARARSYIRYLILECSAPTPRPEDPERLPLTSDSARGQDVPSSPQDCVVLCPRPYLPPHRPKTLQSLLPLGTRRMATLGR
jgi:hypothetical protein